MSSQVHRIELVAKDGTRQAFDSIKKSADQDARALQDMGEKGKRSFTDLAVGAAALGAAFTMASRSAQDQARQIDAINRLYGESADAILQQSEAIQDNTRFSNDAARQAAITGATLAENYQLSAEQISVLIERSADLAQIHGIDLADAMERVSGAIRGEGEAAELLGLNMSDSAVASAAAAAGIDNWRTTATEAEKAAFRYQLVLEQTTSTMGAASDAADTTAGKIAHLGNEVQDVAQNFAAWTGPVGEATAALSSHAVEIALVGGGLAKLATGFKEAGAAAKVAQAGTSLLNLAMGPAGLVAAAGLAVVAVYEVAKAFDDANLSAKEAKSEVDNYVNSIATLQKAGGDQAAVGGLAAHRQQIQQIVLDSVAAQTQLQAAQRAATQAAQEEMESSASGSLDALDAAHERTKAAQEHVKELEHTIIEQDQLNQLTEDYFQIYTEPNPLNFDLVLARLAELDAQLAAGTISADTYIKQIHELNEQSDSYGLTIEEIVAGQRLNVGMTQEQAAAAKEHEAALDRVTRRWQEYDRAIRETTAAEAEQLDRSTRKWQEYDTAVREQGETDRERAQANRELLDSLSVESNAEADRLERNKQKWDEYDAAVRKANDSRVQSSNAAQDYLDQLAEERDIVAENAKVADELAGATVEVANASAHATGAIDGLTKSTRDWEGPVRRMKDALSDFKDIQDGIIGQQDVFNQQFSEYGSQINAIERAQEVLNRRREEGQQLSEDDLAFLDEAVPALERLEGGQDDAAVSAGKLAAQYGENMSQGDRLNDTLGGLDGTLQGVSASVQTLVSVLIELGSTHPEPSVTLSGAGDALAEALALNSALNNIAGVYNATVNVGANIDPALSNFGGMFSGGGVVGAAGGRVVRVNEGGQEMATLPTGDNVWLPSGTLITPHAASVMGNKGGGGRAFYNYGHITVVANNPQDFWRQMNDYGLAGR